MLRYFVFVLIVHSLLILQSHSKSIIKKLPGYSGDLPFKFETGYMGIGEKEEIQFSYYFVESMRNPKEDPLIYYISGGPGASGLLSFMDEIGPLSLNKDNLTLALNPNAWTQMANIIFVDMPAGTGFSYAKTEEGWISSDTILASQATEFIKKFLIDHPTFLRNPLYISGISYVGLIIPRVALDLYEGNERGDQPQFNIQGYTICSPLTDKFKDFNSRLEYAHRVGLISYEVHKSATENCHGNYVNTNSANTICANSLQRYEECTRRINVENILDPFCDENDPTLDCERDYRKALNKWANIDAVQQALNIRQGKVEKWEVINYTLHYQQDKNDTIFYSYDIFSSFSYHKKLSSKSCRALIYSGDHDLTFPYVGVEQWITSLNLDVEVPWIPFYVDDQVGGYETKYAKNNYSLTFVTVKGAGHSIAVYKPKEAWVLAQRWFTSPDDMMKSAFDLKDPMEDHPIRLLPDYYY
ncbi:serine carboxypeptidase-like 13 [Bidens hawaiensis]|uniref:serine carboxypeptidase-like 13 n=1 Tax=Bidens hawaiensis TaxID=980011 RepID=UPI004049AECC